MSKRDSLNLSSRTPSQKNRSSDSPVKSIFHLVNNTEITPPPNGHESIGVDEIKDDGIYNLTNLAHLKEQINHPIKDLLGVRQRQKVIKQVAQNNDKSITIHVVNHHYDNLKKELLSEHFTQNCGVNFVHSDNEKTITIKSSFNDFVQALKYKNNIYKGYETKVHQEKESPLPNNEYLDDDDIHAEKSIFQSNHNKSKVGLSWILGLIGVTGIGSGIGTLIGKYSDTVKLPIDIQCSKLDHNLMLKGATSGAMYAGAIFIGLSISYLLNKCICKPNCCNPSDQNRDQLIDADRYVPNNQ